MAPNLISTYFPIMLQCSSSGFELVQVCPLGREAKVLSLSANHNFLAVVLTSFHIQHVSFVHFAIIFLNNFIHILLSRVNAKTGVHTGKYLKVLDSES